MKNGCRPITQYTLTKLIARHVGAFIAQLFEEVKATFLKLKENIEKPSSLNECDAFISGFQLGAKIMTEVMEKAETPDVDDI